MSDNQNHEQKFVPPPLPPRDSNASSELTSQENANTVVPDSAEHLNHKNILLLLLYLLLYVF